nr:RNA-directed DNA polymerase, eukaryota [Tanacetum cinerariifolium]
FIKEDFDGSDAEKEGDNNVSMVPDSVKEDVNVQAEEKANLQEIPLGGCSFTWCHRSAKKMSKLDRFIMSEGLLGVNPNFSALTLDKYLSDHRPIMLRDSSRDYGPIPFRMYHYWFEIDGCKEMISKAWCECPIVEVNPIMEIIKDIQEVEKVDNLEAAQKAKIKWAIEGDENTKFYHGILNKKRNQLCIRGVLKDSMWIDNPVVVKKEFLEHISVPFQQPRRIRPVINIDFPCTIRDVLNRFSFGAKWCGWIHECLRSSRGSVLVNGSPTEEF